MERDPILEKLLSVRLAGTRIAEAAGISTAAVSQWRRVPVRHLDAVAKVTGIPASDLRPDTIKDPVAA